MTAKDSNTLFFISAHMHPACKFPLLSALRVNKTKSETRWPKENTGLQVFSSFGEAGRQGSWNNMATMKICEIKLDSNPWGQLNGNPHSWLYKKTLWGHTKEWCVSRLGSMLNIYILLLIQGFPTISKQQFSLSNFLNISTQEKNAMFFQYDLWN